MTALCGVPVVAVIFAAAPAKFVNGGSAQESVVGAGSIGIRGALQHLCLPDVQDRLRLAAVCGDFLAWGFVHLSRQRVYHVRAGSEIRFACLATG